MKTSTVLLSIVTVVSFTCSYFFNLTLDNIEQYLALTAVVFIDGFFGTIAGIKREGFKTYKALRILKTYFAWLIILTTLLMVEKGFEGSGWLSETVLIPFLIFQLISALKNASMAGFIKIEEVNSILDKIDQHKGTRKK